MINRIIEDKCIQQIGVEYSDLIISNENFISFIKEINAIGYKIVDITWWEHKKISDNDNKTSMGGPVDITNNKFYWGETNYSKTFASKGLVNNLKEVLDYYNDFSKNKKDDFFPSVTLDIAFNK